MAFSSPMPLYVVVPSSCLALINEFGKPNEKVLESLLYESHIAGHPGHALLRVTYTRRSTRAGVISTHTHRKISILENWYENLTGNKIKYD